MNCAITQLQKTHIPSKYKQIEESVYLDLGDADGFSMYRIGISIDISDKKVSAKELEQFVEPHFLYIVTELRFDSKTLKYYVLGGELEDVQKFKSILG